MTDDIRINQDRRLPKMCQICFIQIYDYLTLPEKVKIDHPVHPKRLQRILLPLTQTIWKFLSSLSPLSVDCVKREVDATVIEFLKMMRIQKGVLQPHQEQLAEKIAALRLIEKCRSIGLGSDFDFIVALFQDKSVCFCKDSIQIWLGVKLINLWSLIETVHDPTKVAGPVEMSLGIGQNTQVRYLARHFDDRDSYDELCW